jgi:exopolysaccharide production protein ExoZ
LVPPYIRLEPFRQRYEVRVAIWVLQIRRRAHHITENISNRLGITLTSIDARIGAAGVDLFFIISGFIIVYASEPLFGKPAGPQVFFLRRLIRIAPLYWTVTAFFIVLFLASPNGFAATIAASNTSIGAIIASFMFLPFARPDGTMFPLHSVGWTLNYEVFFYVIFEALLFYPGSALLQRLVFCSF